MPPLPSFPVVAAADVVAVLLLAEVEAAKVERRPLGPSLPLVGLAGLVAAMAAVTNMAAVAAEVGQPEVLFLQLSRLSQEYLFR